MSRQNELKDWMYRVTYYLHREGVISNDERESLDESLYEQLEEDDE